MMVPQCKGGAFTGGTIRLVGSLRLSSNLPVVVAKYVSTAVLPCVHLTFLQSEVESCLISTAAPFMAISLRPTVLHTARGQCSDIQAKTWRFAVQEEPV